MIEDSEVGSSFDLIDGGQTVGGMYWAMLGQCMIIFTEQGYTLQNVTGTILYRNNI